MVNKIISSLPSEVLSILGKLKQHGEAYLVGGCVRDILLGIAPHDFDFTSNIEAATILEVFSEYNPRLVNEKYQIVNLTTSQSSYDIIRLRADKSSLNRSLTEIEFVNELGPDLQRRDFTINAIAFNGESLQYTEHALEDVENRVLRFIGEPGIRIQEDPIRASRGVRFAAKCNLTIEPATFEAMKSNAHLIHNISIDLVRQEFEKIALGTNPALGLKLMSETGLLSQIFPGVELSTSIPEGLEISIVSVLATILQHVESTEIERLLLSLHYGKKTIKAVKRTVLNS